MDADDTIVRRRLIQKVTFLTEDLAATETPDPQTLEQFYDNNRQRYEIPEQFTFQHIYFSSDRDTETSNGSAKTMATKAVSNPALTGDPFMLQSQYARRSQREIGDLFGRAFAERLIAIETWANGRDRFSPPMAGMRCWWKNRRPVQGLPYQQVKDKVLLDWRQERLRRGEQSLPSRIAGHL